MLWEMLAIRQHIRLSLYEISCKYKITIAPFYFICFCGFLKLLIAKDSRLVMSNILPSPVLTTKTGGGSYRMGNTIFRFGTASMQGWRTKMEDAQNAIPFLDKQTSLFAVYGGHGGREVSLYCEKNLPSRLKECSDFKNGDIEAVAALGVYFGEGGRSG